MVICVRSCERKNDNFVYLKFVQLFNIFWKKKFQRIDSCTEKFQESRLNNFLKIQRLVQCLENCLDFALEMVQILYWRSGGPDPIVKIGCQNILATSMSRSSNYIVSPF